MHSKGALSEKALTGFIETCYLLYEQKMYQTAYRILQDSGRAEDAVQEAFLKLMKGRVYFEDAQSDSCKRYLITVIKHSAIDLYNKKKREHEFVSFFNENIYEKGLPLQEDGVQKTEMKELILHLRPKYYDVVDCLAVQNLSVKETSLALGISEVNVRKRFERAKKMLKIEWMERESV